jgi:hypothetical protein
MHAADSKDDLILFECQISCHRICMQQIVKMTSLSISSILFACQVNCYRICMQQILKMTSPNNLVDSLCMPDHSPQNMHAAYNNKYDISSILFACQIICHRICMQQIVKMTSTNNLFDSLSMPDHLPLNMH